ncbi:hypothetical protein EVAR_11201_1 [Eumeta japonica]|uniref:Uncharacterized protein n=1 Tax=Eumeta variegata TaxID=151549 RepID=A0A4C1U4K0_EUMVA|nr:hypothetical protein EVAR_11201_1 [Eumeta japonica]
MILYYKSAGLVWAGPGVLVIPAPLLCWVGWIGLGTDSAPESVDLKYHLSVGRFKRVDTCGVLDEAAPSLPGELIHQIAYHPTD